jgi:Histidine kinase-like ATPase domain
MAAMSRSADRTARTPATTASRTPEFRWRRVFPGDERQLGELRRWLEVLLPADPARDDVVSVAVEYATNAIKFSRSGRGGWFAVEITGQGRTVRVAVADGGGRVAPHVIDDPMGEHGRGLVMVRALSARTGVCGDHRGRLVWAEIPWTGELLDHVLRPAPRLPRVAAEDLGAARTGEQAPGPAAPVPPWFHRGRTRLPRPGAQPY